MTPQEKFEIKLKAHRQGKIVTKDEYINSYTPMNFECTACGYQFRIKPKNIFIAKDCRGCIAKRQHETAAQPIAIFQARIDKVWGKNNYTTLENYTNNSTQVKIRHEICGKVWKTTPLHLLHGHGCPICAVSSYGETIIYNILKQNNITFEYQKNIKIDNNTHLFDFYLPHEKIWVEYDGIQHADENHPWYSEERKQRDIAKNEYVESIDETIVRIPHTATSADDILSYLNLHLETPLVIREKSSLLIKQSTNRVEIVKYYETHTANETAKQFGVSKSTVERAARLLNFKKTQEVA